MSTYDPFNPDRPLFVSGCSCGRHASDLEHAQEAQAKIDVEQASANFIEAS